MRSTLKPVMRAILERSLADNSCVSATNIGTVPMGFKTENKAAKTKKNDSIFTRFARKDTPFYWGLYQLYVKSEFQIKKLPQLFNGRIDFFEAGVFIHFGKCFFALDGFVDYRNDLDVVVV